jgi:hypothetical protein
MIPFSQMQQVGFVHCVSYDFRNMLLVKVPLRGLVAAAETKVGGYGLRVPTAAVRRLERRGCRVGEGFSDGRGSSSLTATNHILQGLRKVVFLS